ncbi:PH domain-containing protein [Nesterenkonia sp. F]|uniref:PH domain-containing protein n=1 Tax=Nesterenkonia sp. F TaxID=795955 RepID=UPI000255D167|nr:PH domain-containing protein [Nesterenkonia sp. F]
MSQHPEYPERVEPAEEQPADESPAEGEQWFDSTWTRVHPLSPVVRGWLALVAIPFVALTSNWETITDLWEALRSGELTEAAGRHPMITLAVIGGILLLILLIFGGFALSWWFTRYKITDDHVMVKSGIFVRQHRQARIDRVQAVDLRQPLLARLTGLAELKFEVAEGDGTAATLAFLTRSAAEQMRTEIMDRASGRTAARDRSAGSAGEQSDDAEQPGDGGQSGDGAPDGPAAPASGSARATPPELPEAEDRQIVQVPTGRLIGSVLTGGLTVALLVVVLLTGLASGVGLTIFVLSGGDLADDPGARLGASLSGISLASLPALIPAAIGLLAGYYQQFSSGFRFTATMTAAGLKLRYGLLETTTQTVPPGRVQAIQIQRPLLWRPFGWARIMVVVAGYGAGEKRSVLLPVGTREDVLAVVAEMFPDLQVADPAALIDEGLTGIDEDGAFTAGPRAARWLDPIVRRRRGGTVTPAALLARDGRLGRRLTLVPHERIQSLSIQQGPVQRLAGLATLRLHSPAGPFQAQLTNQRLADVHGFFEHESRQAAVARRIRDREQWMMPEELHEFEKMMRQGSAP